jgi:hypothetical protein
VPEAAVIVAARRFKRDLRDREARQMEELVRLWRGLLEPIEAQVELLANDLAKKRADGQIVTEGAMYRLERFQAILAQAKVWTDAFNGEAERRIRNGQREIAELAIDNSVESIRIVSPRVLFERLPIEAVEAMFGMAGDGQPLGNLLAKNFGPVGTRFGQELSTGTALGWNPRKTAATAAKTLEIPLQQAMVTTRTEQNRVYRETSRTQYQESRVVAAQMRMSARDTRVCPACLMADGEITPLNTPLAEHPQGRCTTIPILADEELPRYQTGREWFLTKDEETQRETLGNARYEAWRDGRFDLSALVGRKSHETWGESLYVPSLEALTAAA